MEVKVLQNVGRHFIVNGETISVAESVTGGLLQGAFTAMPDTEKFFEGGITAYNIGQKVKHLYVRSIEAIECNCVSEQIAVEIALGVCSMFQSIWGIGITGYATSVAESGNKIFAYYAVAKKGTTIFSGKIEPVDTDPEKVKTFYVLTILSLFKNYFEGSNS